MNENKQKGGISYEEELRNVKEKIVEEVFLKADGICGKLNGCVERESVILNSLKDAKNKIEKLEEITALPIIEKMIKDNPQNIKIDEKTLLNILSKMKAEEFERLANEWNNFKKNRDELYNDINYIKKSLIKLHEVNRLLINPSKVSPEFEIEVYLESESWKEFVENFNKLHDFQSSHELVELPLDTIEKIEWIKKVIRYLKENGENSTDKRSPAEIFLMKENAKELEEALKNRRTLVYGMTPIVDVTFLKMVFITDKIIEELDKWESEEWEKVKERFDQLFENHKRFSDYVAKVVDSFHHANSAFNEIKKDWINNLRRTKNHNIRQ